MEAPASFGRRLAAALIDTAVLALMLLALATLGFVVLALLPALVPEAQQDAFTQAMVVPEALLVLLMAVVLAWLYSSTLHSSVWQATIGKRLLGLHVTDLQGRPISFARASARHLSTCLVWLSLGIGFLLIALPWRQGVHDLIAGTIVARRRRVVDERPVPIPAAVQSWDGGRWQPNASDSVMPIRLRLPKRAWWLRLIAVLWFATALIFIALAVAGAPATAVGLSAGAWLVLTAGLVPFIVRQRGVRMAAWDAAMAAAFESHRQPEEVLRCSSLVSVGVRPWLLELVLARWIVMLILRQGCLLVTDRRLLLFGVNTSASAIIRLDRVEQLSLVEVRTLSAGVFRPRLALNLAAAPGLQVTFPFAWRSRAWAVAAAISPGIAFPGRVG